MKIGKVLAKSLAVGLCLWVPGYCLPVAAAEEKEASPYSVVGSMTDWGTESDIAMYEYENGRFEGSAVINKGEWEFLIRRNSDWNEYWGAYDYNEKCTYQSNSTVAFSLENSTQVTFCIDTSGDDMTQWSVSYYYTDSDGQLVFVNTGKSKETEIIEDKTKPDISVFYETKTDDYIFFDNSLTGWDEVYAYWSNIYNERVTDIEDNDYGCYLKVYDSGVTGYPPIGFPGTKMTQVDGTDIWQIRLPYNASSIVFSNGKTFEQIKNGENAFRTSDIIFSDIKNAGQVYNVTITGDNDADYDHGAGLTKTQYTAKGGNWSDYSGKYIKETFGEDPDLNPENIRNVGVTGSFTGWADNTDIAMNDDDGDGIFEALVDIPSVTEKMLTDIEPQGSPAGEKHLRFMIRVIGNPEKSWGSYNKQTDTVFDSDISIPITEEVLPGDHVKFRVFLDTNRNNPDAVSANEEDSSKGISSDSKADYKFLYAGYDSFCRLLERGAYTYEYNNNSLTLISYTGTESEVSVPSYVDNIPVRVIAKNAFYQNHSVSKITLPPTVLKAEEYAFNGCSSLKELNIGQGITEIMPLSVFYCDTFEAYTSDDNSDYSTSDGVLFNKAGTTIISYPQAKSENSYTVPDQVNQIESYAFYNCMSLKKITLPDNINNINPKALGYYLDKASGTDLKNEEFVIIGKQGTVAENYANENGFSFEKAEVLPESVVLNRTSAVIEKGSTIILTATISPEDATNKAVLWTSSDSTVASVGGGKVTAISEGTATITVRTINGKTASCNIIVKLPTIAVSSVKLNKTSLTLTKGKTERLTATILPSNATNKAITWTSSNSYVASVSGGTVTAKSAGTAVITARSNNGRTASCTVTVKNPIVNATSLKLDKTATGLGVGETTQLKVTAYPSNSTITWTSSNTSVVSVYNGKITGKKVGTATITAVSGKVRATCSVTVKAAPTSVSLSKTAVSIGVGEKFSVSSIIPANSAAVSRTYSSSNPSVVKMTRTSWIGDFVGVKPGTANVTVRLYNGKTASCLVVVKAAPTSVSLSKTSMSIAIGESFTLSAVLPANTAAAARTYYSSNSSVLQMTKTNWVGSFKALKKGTAKITVKLYNGKTASCTVYVNPAPSYVRLSKSSITLKIGQSSSLSAIIPAGTSAAVRTYRSSNSAIVKMTKTDWTGNFKALKTGSAWVTVTLFNGKSARCLVTVVK